VKVVFDTNILISAIINPSGRPAFLLKLVLLGKIRLVFAKELLEEVLEVFAREKIKKIFKKRKGRAEAAEKALREICLISDWVKISPDGEVIIKDDPSDDKFIHCAVEGEADFVITGDQHLLRLSQYQGIKIVTPGDFLKIVEVVK
jgi:hypothetical protein